MERMKTFGLWLLAFVAFWIFVNVITYLWLNPGAVGGTIYNITHKSEVVNEVK